MIEPSPLDEVLIDMVRLIPRGRLASYSDLSALAGELGYPCTARRVARTLSMFGADTPWWRVVQAGGTIADQVRDEALILLQEDGLAVTGRRVPLNQVRWNPDLQYLRAELAV